MRRGMFEVDGAGLYHEVRGDGPALLLISGAGGDAGYFTGVADELADAFTVITYDRRGNSRSTGQGDALMDLSQQATDARALIDGLADGRALVFGSSGGAIIGLTLAARHWEAVVGLIAHEPPAVNVLPDGDPARDFFAEVAEAYARGGGPPLRAGRARRGYVSVARRSLEEVPRQRRPSLRPGVAGLRRLPAGRGRALAPFPIVLGAGSADRGTYYARPSIEIARGIGVPWVEFPGIHMEFLPRPAGFAAAVRVWRRRCARGAVRCPRDGGDEDAARLPVLLGSAAPFIP